MNIKASTIFALSTAPGKAGVALIRISGSHALKALDKLTDTPVEPRRASLRTLYHPITGDVLDKGLVLYFKGPHSFTGEDIVELHIHGGRAVTLSLLDALTGLEGLSMAEPGDFTRRAFRNERLDLVEVEGLADLIDAETEAQRKQALRQMDGGLSSLYLEWRTKLVKAMALFEAGIDFVDEEDVPASLQEPVRQELTGLHESLVAHLNDGRRGERLRDGLKLVIIGKPNTGKSSLMNLLTKRNAAIVSDEAGTTRDVIETHLDIGGYPVILTDTAGIRHSEEDIERRGIVLAIEQAKNADLVLILSDITDETPSNEALEGLKEIDSAAIRVLNKVDLAENSSDVGNYKADCVISAKTGAGLDDLVGLITQQAKNISDTSTAPSLTRARHRSALQSALAHIETSLAKLGSEEELVAEEMRCAAQHIGSLTGHVGPEDLLDVIFAEFCIGK